MSRDDWFYRALYLAELASTFEYGSKFYNYYTRLADVALDQAILTPVVED